MIENKHYKITRGRLPAHEMIGLNIEIIESKKTAKEKIKGKIVDETMKTFLIEKENGEEKTIPKEGNIFLFQLGNETAEIAGEKIQYSPVERLKSLWRGSNA